jgi:serine/threonine-protein kinase RsbW
LSAIACNEKILKLPSNPTCLCELEGYVQQVVMGERLPDNLYPNILISLTEAVTNAMIHGNRYDDRKNIVVSCQRQNGHVHIFISDEGSGFDPCQLPDPTCDELLDCEGGRGVFLMKQLTDEVHFLDQGRTVQLMWRV